MYINITLICYTIFSEEKFKSNLLNCSFSSVIIFSCDLLSLSVMIINPLKSSRISQFSIIFINPSRVAAILVLPFAIRIVIPIFLYDKIMENQ